MSIETIIRPAVNTDTTPVRTVRAGQAAAEPVLVMIGRRGGTRSFAWSGNASLNSYLIRVHRERGDVNQILSGSGG